MFLFLYVDTKNSFEQVTQTQLQVIRSVMSKGSRVGVSEMVVYRALSGYGW